MSKVIRAIYLSIEQQNVITALRKLLAKEIEKKRNPEVIYKCTAISVTPGEIKVSFISKNPCNVKYTNIDLGKCSSKRLNTTDVKYNIDKSAAFNTYRKKVNNFILILEKTDRGDMAKTFNPETSEIIEYTDYESW